MISIIAAVGKNGELGKNGGLCFKIPGDMKFFKSQTFGHPVLMGLTTWHSLPGKLEGREHFVLTFDPKEPLPDGVTAVTDLPKFLKKWQGNSTKLFVIGGGSVYKQCLPFADELILTEVEAEDKNADTFFPKFDQTSWKRTVISTQTSENPPYSFVRYERKKAKEML
ncbi:dihydrofolate reductase [Candidatus Saccharibacteria bacterium]|nr:dihydrofolate reductase [Candidatus Saccharibacteria bacterium]